MSRPQLEPHELTAEQIFTLDSLLGESLPPSLCFRGFRILVEGMCHFASAGKHEKRKSAVKRLETAGSVNQKEFWMTAEIYQSYWKWVVWVKTSRAELKRAKRKEKLEFAKQWLKAKCSEIVAKLWLIAIMRKD